ncbi:hypothetical protein [Prosthecobacter sp.]|uniref:hypothetical protein n=1 Tax=Prosthecobacter sp. TaxID=1965333 RepID=UPI002ABAC7F2|nr:hypothetical protein [Prosthecobacter sp.]MDZ4402789.1 hypothetical protein [Prosthecobacter sp.]
MSDNIIKQLLQDSSYRRQQLLAPPPPKPTLREQVNGWVRVMLAIGVIGGLMWFGHRTGGILFFLPAVVLLFTFEYSDIATVSWSRRRKVVSTLGLFLLMSLLVALEFHFSTIVLTAIRDHGAIWIFASRLGLVLGFILAMAPLWIAFHIYERLTKPCWTSHPVCGWRIYDGIYDPKNDAHPH